MIRGGPVADFPAITVVVASGRALPTRAKLHVNRALAAGERVVVACSARSVRLRCKQCKAERETAVGACARCRRATSSSTLPSSSFSTKLISFVPRCAAHCCAFSVWLRL